jgi:hypothetical protein
MYLEYVALDHYCQSMKLCMFQGRLWLRWYLPSDVDQTEMPSDLSVTWHMEVCSLYDSKTGILCKFDVYVGAWRYGWTSGVEDHFEIFTERACYWFWWLPFQPCPFPETDNKGYSVSGTVRANKISAYLHEATNMWNEKKENEVNFGEWYGKHWHLHLAQHRVSESSSAKYGPGKDFALCVNQNLWHITMSVHMGLPACVVFYVRNSFLIGNIIYIIATQKKISAILCLLALFERCLEDKNGENLMTPMPQLDWVDCILCQF